MTTELEIKLSVARSDLDRAVTWLLSQPDTRESDTLRLSNTYYDTPAGDLNRQKIALRIRKMGDRYIQTLKTRGEFVDGAHRRHEWEWPLIDTKLRLELIADTPVAQSVNYAELEPVFETNFERRVVMIEQGESLIEVAIDSGETVAEQQSRPLNEIEFELKAGDASALLTWARRLADEVPVFLNLVSKAEQGYFLAGRYCPELVGKNEALSVTEFLQMLGACWLLDKPFPVGRYDLSSVAETAGTVGCGELCEHVITELAKGVAVRDFAENATQLGVLQLKLASARRNKSATA